MPRFINLVLTAILCCAAASQPARADLQWDAAKIELTAQPADKSVDAKFGFVNSGAATVTIESAQASCGCMAPTLAKKVFAPGERGELLVRFLIGDRRGVQSKVVRVQIQGQPKPVELSLIVKIPELLRIVPPVLIWQQGEPGEAKTFAVQTDAGTPVLVQKVTCTNPNMELKLETIREAEQYRITVTPKDTEKAGMALVTVEAMVMNQLKTFPAYLQIRPKAPTFVPAERR